MRISELLPELMERDHSLEVVVELGYLDEDEEYEEGDLLQVNEAVVMANKLRLLCVPIGEDE